MEPRRCHDCGAFCVTSRTFFSFSVTRQPAKDGAFCFVASEQYIGNMKKHIDAIARSWITTTIGVASCGASIYMFCTGSPWENVAGAATFGVGMIWTKDARSN